MKNLSFYPSAVKTLTVNFKVKFLPPTNTKGARVSIKNMNTGLKKIVPFNYNFNECQSQFREYVTEYAPHFNFISQFWDGDNIYITYSFDVKDRDILDKNSVLYNF